MVPKPLDYRFRIDDDTYLLVQPTRGGDRRIRQQFALAIAAAPAVIDSMDGENLMVEAIAQECLKEAPPYFWQELPATASSNGQPRQVVNCDGVPLAVWELFRTEVLAFRAQCFPGYAAESPPVDAAGAEPAAGVATVETLPAILRGRAE